MKIDFRLEENTGLNPSIVAYFKSVPVGSFSYQYYKLRHPGAIYNLMVNKLADSIGILCKALKERSVENIKSYFRLVLHDFFQFYESCYEIMVCFCKEHTLPSENEQLHKWIRKKYDFGETFFKYVKDQIKDLKYYHNEIKHSSNDIQFIVFKTPSEITAAYFLDMPKEAYAGPLDPILLNRELKRLYFLIYFISEKLKQVLVKHLKETCAFNLQPSSVIIKDDAFRKLNEDINSLSDFYLLSEVGKTVYTSSIENNTITFTESLITETLFYKYYAKGMNLEMNLKADGYNNSAFIPFCGLNQIGSKFYYKTKDDTLKELKIIDC